MDRMVTQKGIPWPQVCDGQALDGEIPKLYRVAGTPALFVLDRDARIVARLHSAEKLAAQVEDLLASPATAAQGAERDTWQRPARVMDLLEVGAGQTVADVGAGEGYFTFHLAARVGATGKVYAVDISEKVLAQVRERAARTSAVQVQTILGQADDPKLPSGLLDAALVVDAYHEFRAYDAMLRGIHRALKPGGRLGILDENIALGQSRQRYHEQHHIPAELVIEDAVRNGLRLVYFEADFAGPRTAKQYLVILEKPRATEAKP